MNDDTQPTETQQQVYEWQRQYKTVSLELDQARFEIEALQRKLNEYSNALQECQANADQNKESVEEMAATLLATTQDCAAMRSALEEVVRLSDRKHNAWDRAKAALALDAGKDFVPADKMRVIVAACRKLLLRRGVFQDPLL